MSRYTLQPLIWLARISTRKCVAAGMPPFAVALNAWKITAPGRRTGVLRTIALLAVPYPEDYLIVGSNWGRPSHPSWSTNLRAVDAVLVRVGARESRRQVRLIEGDERTAAWQCALDYWPGYQLEHDLADGREFRLFALPPPTH